MARKPLRTCNATVTRYTPGAAHAPLRNRAMKISNT